MISSLQSFDDKTIHDIEVHRKQTGSSIVQLLGAYSRTWSRNLSTEERRAIIATIWEPDGTYTDPTASSLSPSKLTDHIERMVELLGEAELRLAGQPVFYGNIVAFSWEYADGNGKRLGLFTTFGTDFVELSDRGKLRSIVGLFGTRLDVPA
ncbi:hypothetical protein [Methylibium sp.]|uniref:hypothetical protein n=1 Tax=Methylibium sp. TaxID=2067992 RepID=UPI003D0E8A20